MLMRKFYYAILTLLALTSCANQYTIQGTSSITVVNDKVFDGSKLYLKAMNGDDFVTIDSCEVIHGKFRFSGTLDSVRMASLFIDDRGFMPVVVEEGDINVRIDDTQRTVSGTPLNDVLYDFLKKHKQLGSQMAELDHRYPQMLLDGIDEATIHKQLMAEAAKISQQEDSLVTDFVINNFDNVVGRFLFVQMTSSVPQVEHIMSKAPDAFKNDPVVSEFYKTVSDTRQTQQLLEHTTPADIDDSTIQNILNGQ